MFCMFPDSKSDWKKGATAHSFIRKEITSYRIGTLNTFAHLFFVRSYKDQCINLINQFIPGFTIAPTEAKILQDSFKNL